ncbi:MAG: hypothetical protein EXR75_14720 [Myxococcales bacterium]|nr:hypothetical protein [Myxococcales bacterium]
MDVICDRCRTRYDFDEALVPTRGTTVKCTQCAHQFRVFRPEGAAKLMGWAVRRADGSELRFAAMRELQAAITDRTIGQADLLIPGDGGPVRALGKIDELASLFPRDSESDDAVTGPQKARTTATGDASAQEETPRHTSADNAVNGARTGDTLPPPGPSAPAASGFRRASALSEPESRAARLPAPPAAMSSEAGRRIDVENTLARVQTALRRSLPDDPLTDDDSIDGPTPGFELLASRATDVMTPRSSDVASLAPHTPSPSAARPSVLRRSETYSEPNVSSFARQSTRPSFGKWLVGLLLVGAAAVVVLALMSRDGAPEGVAATAQGPDEKVVRFLADGDRLFIDGDLDGAREHYVRASGVSESEPLVLQALGRVAVAQADLAWLAMRLDPKSASTALDLAIERIAPLAESLAKVEPSGSESAALNVDLLRLRGRIAEARKLTSKVSADTPDGSRTLAMLDLAEPEPGWELAADRLRVASRAEKKLGRAKALLVYALAGRGDVEGARRELTELETLTPRHPSVAALRRHVDARALDANPGKGGTSSGRANADAKSDAKADANADGKAVRGEADQAPKSNAELLKENPDYVPGLIELADSRWASGDRPGAVALYQRVRESAPGTSWAEHSGRRIREAATNADAPTPPRTAPPPTAPPPPAAKHDDGPAPIDTSDLPQ